MGIKISANTKNNAISGNAFLSEKRFYSYFNLQKLFNNNKQYALSNHERVKKFQKELF